MDKRLAVNSRQGASALEHPTSRHIVLELVQNECSLGELCQKLKLSLSLLTYHVNRLRRIGLVQVARQTNRMGRPIKRYRAVAKEFFVPSRIASRSTSNALAEELRSALEQDRIRLKSAGTLYLIDDQGRRLIRPVGGGPFGSTFEAWIITELSALDAEHFGTELRTLLSKYAAPKTGKTRPFLVHCALAPRQRT